MSMVARFEQAFAELERPFAWIDLDVLDANISYILKQSGTKRIRIATKSVRSVPLLSYIRSQLPNFAGWMTFTAAESVFLLEQGFDDILIGYPVYEEKLVRKLLAFTSIGKRVTFMVDRYEHIVFLERLAQETREKVRVCIDLNVSNDFRIVYFGTRRSSLNSLKSLDDFIKALQKAPHIIVDGVMGYEAQLAGVGDVPANLIKGMVIRQLQKLAKNKVTAFRQFAVAHLKAYFDDIRFINGGGSGSISYTVGQREISEVTVGSAFFAPALFDTYTSLVLKPATGFALRITRKPHDKIVVCHGGGYIASGAVGKDRLPSFYESGRFKLFSLEGAGEVQTPIRVINGDIEIGDTVYMRHAKAGELCERFLQLHAVRGEVYENSFLTYRGDGKCFL